MAGRKRYHYNCPKRDGYKRTIVNAYVRVGSPAKWTVIGEICLSCNAFAPTSGTPFH